MRLCVLMTYSRRMAAKTFVICRTPLSRRLIDCWGYPPSNSAASVKERPVLRRSVKNSLFVTDAPPFEHGVKHALLDHLEAVFYRLQFGRLIC